MFLMNLFLKKTFTKNKYVKLSSYYNNIYMPLTSKYLGGKKTIYKGSLWNDLKPKSSLKAGVKLAILKADDKEDRRAKNDDEPKVAKKSKKDKDNNDDDVKVAKKGKNKAKDDDDDKRVAKNKERVKRISYEVKRGDTLFSISQRYNVSVSQLKTWNKATKNLKPGQDLVLYLAKS